MCICVLSVFVGCCSVLCFTGLSFALLFSWSGEMKHLKCQTNVEILAECMSHTGRDSEGHSKIKTTQHNLPLLCVSQLKVDRMVRNLITENIYYKYYYQIRQQITNKLVEVNCLHTIWWNIVVIKFDSDLRQVGCFFLGTPVSSTIKTDCCNITKILLKVELNMILVTLTNILGCLDQVS
jgi:hypothetical protein